MDNISPFFLAAASSFLVTMYIGHEIPSGYKRGRLKTISACILFLLALADFAMTIATSLNVQNTYNEVDYTIALFTRNALSSIFMFGWAMYIFKSGPLRSKIWLRVFKSILYCLSSVSLFGLLSSDFITKSIATAIILFVLLVNLLIAIIETNNNIRKMARSKLMDDNTSIKRKGTIAYKSSSSNSLYDHYFAKFCTTLLMAGFFIASSICFCEEGDAMHFLAFIYFPWFTILFVYYTYMIWSKHPATGERILLLPLLQKISLFQNYSVDSIVTKKELIKTVLPFLLTSTVCPFISTIYTLCQNGYRYNTTFPTFLCAIAPILLLVILARAYSMKWLYAQKQSKGEDK